MSSSLTENKFLSNFGFPSFSQKHFVLGITGASGAIYAIRVIERVLTQGHYLHCVASSTAEKVIAHELGLTDKNLFCLPNVFQTEIYRRIFIECRNQSDKTFSSKEFLTEIQNRWKKQTTFYPCDDFFAAIASGSFATDGMAIVPCSTGTLAAIANGMSQNLIHRAAEVHLKERRKLILVARETPLSLIQISNMESIAKTGGIILPASPSFYHQPQSLAELIDTVVDRILAQLGIPRSDAPVWKPNEEIS
ncbi:MAG: UbiX family flavin prenyltransferase [Planctomycetaceae bacterium]|jgi:4-hydroxy-3-polyprenylbenzoate decarboxylase|nr:UbiX family flavin prenyltransferase [Planctomycetaceae bacterium]